MPQARRSRPNPILARVVMALVLLTALSTLAAVVLLATALLPIPQALRPKVGVGLFLLLGTGAGIMLARRARRGGDALRQRLDALLLPLGFTFREAGGQTSFYQIRYQNLPLRVACSVAGTPQRPSYHLQLTLPSRHTLKLAVSMADYRQQFDASQFGAPWQLSAPESVNLLAYTNAPAQAEAWLSLPAAQAAILQLFTAALPGVRSLTVQDGHLTLRYRHLWLDALTPAQIQRWMDALISLERARG
jgi:hypothetical protein